MKLIHQLVTKIRQALGEREIKNFSEICEVSPILNLKLEKSALSDNYADLQAREVINYKLYMQGYHKFCYHHWRPEDHRRTGFPRFKGNNTGILLWGERGCGKSQILTYATAWAHENSWINFSITDFEEFTNATTESFRFKNGLYLQKDLAKALLQDFKHANEQILLDFDVDTSLYGKYDISGVKDGDPEPCPRKWDPERKIWNDVWKESLYDVEINMLAAKYETMNYRLADKLPDPKKLIELVDYGIENPEVATNVVAEVLE